MSAKLHRSIVETDVEVLHQVSDEINLTDLDMMNAVENALIDTYRKLNGALQGLSAIQVGYRCRVILLRYKKGDEPSIVFNPKVLVSIGSKKSNEGCLSEGDDRYIVRRPRLMKVMYYTKYREKKVEWLPYKKARIFKHELDHLDGILLQDIGEKVGK